MKKTLTWIILILFVATSYLSLQSVETFAQIATGTPSGVATGTATSTSTSDQEKKDEVKELKINSKLANWVLDETRNTLYAISESDKTLLFINAKTLQIENTLILNSNPTDIIADNGKLYISLDQTKQIVVVDTATKEIEKTLATTSDPYRIVKDGNKLYYAEESRFNDVYEYDLEKNTDSNLDIGYFYQPDLAINTEKHILYIADSGTSASNMTYYSITDKKVLSKTNYNNNYGFPYEQRVVQFDGKNVFYATRNFNYKDATKILGIYDGDIIFAKNSYVFTNKNIYDRDTNKEIGQFDVNVNLAEVSDKSDIYIYSNEQNVIKKLSKDSIATKTPSYTDNSVSNSRELKINSALSKWVLDDSSNTIYAISNEEKVLFYINAKTMKLEKTIQLKGNPTDILLDDGIIFVALDDIHQIDVIDKVKRNIKRVLYTSSDPYNIVKDGVNLYYAERDQACDIYRYDLAKNVENRLAGLEQSLCEPSLAINKDKHLLYIGESGTTGANMIYYSLTDKKVVSRTNYNNGYGFFNPSRKVLFDGQNVFYANMKFDKDDATNIYAEYQGDNLLLAKNGFLFTDKNIYATNSHNVVKENGLYVDLVEFSNDSCLYTYSVGTKVITKDHLSKTSSEISNEFYPLSFKSQITNWVLDEPSNTLNAISKDDCALYFIDATTLKINKGLRFNGCPTDIIDDNGKLYITIDNIHQIIVVDSATQKVIKTIYTSSDPYRIVKDGNKLYYTTYDQWCSIHEYDLDNNTDSTLITGSLYNPDIAINIDKHLLYIGESGSSGSNMTYYSIADKKVVGKTNYDNGYGFQYPNRVTLFDGVDVFYAGRSFDKGNPTKILGQYSGDILFAKYGYVFTNTNIYNRDSYKLIKAFDNKVSLVELSKDSYLYTYSKETNAITKLVLDTTPPRGIVSINNGAQITKLLNVTLNLYIGDELPSSGVEYVLISNRSDFKDATWVPYAFTQRWKLSYGSGSGIRKVYVKVKDKAGNVSSTFTSSINYVGK